MKKYYIFMTLWIAFTLAILSDISEYKASGNCDHCWILNLD